MDRHVSRPKIVKQRTQGKVRMKRSSRNYVEGESPRERIVDAARRLFGSKGFYATTTAELAEEASVSVGQIYRLFTDKDDVILAIVEENVRVRLAEMHSIFDAVERRELAMFEAIKAIAASSLHNEDSSLFYEILAEACRNPTVAERFETQTAFYRDGIRRLAALARPDVPAAELDSYGDVMMACFIGLGHRTAMSPPVDAEATSHSTACLMMRALGLAGLESGRVQAQP
ncbi:transcriptional regulator, TetR family [Sphingopyxis indica]|uniref:Transcriptional regulator, TetR family n=2 Tax=Sphingopyxis TaxID=165697 RepID=A0A239I7F7_9SPHN|nr:transcriptional regulator, TetR family [Sphingopyxis indica]